MPEGAHSCAFQGRITPSVVCSPFAMATREIQTAANVNTINHFNNCYNMCEILFHRIIKKKKPGVIISHSLQMA